MNATTLGLAFEASIISVAEATALTANGATSGSAPADGNVYSSGATVMVLGNTGGLAKTGSRFHGWNTAADVSGASYGEGTALVLSGNITLYARWLPNDGFTVTYNGNGNTGGTVPADTTVPALNAPVTVMGNVGGLSRTGSTFARWNTASDGSGVSYDPGDTFDITGDTTLFAEWVASRHTLSYAAGAGGMISGTATQSASYGGSGEKVTAVPDSNHRFAGWSDGLPTASRTDANVMRNISVTANFVANPSMPDSNDGLSNFRKMKYGFFVHYVHGSAYTVTVDAAGIAPASLDELANRFDVQSFADDLATMQVEYVIFTAWHASMNCLWPSPAMDRWLTGHTSRRDLLGEMVDAVRTKGIRVLFYTHPHDGYDLVGAAEQAATGWNPSDRRMWNAFINEVYGDLIDRYGGRIDGLYLDEGSSGANSYLRVDYPRLRQTIKSHNPDLIMIQNNYGNLYSCDIGDQEIFYGGSYDPSISSNAWPANANPMSMVTGSIFWASQPLGAWVARYDAAAMFRMTVLRAGVNSNTGGGVNWAAGPYPDGGWETGVLETMSQVAALIAPIRRAICNTWPSQSWVTPANATINSLANG
ncbi:MAG: InlB B-repeat-containing protein, partial [Verrucomicrobiota bacterium]